ncbi:succinyltransferase-like protein [Chitinophaga niastensis]|uniref:Succinyltransferase-like protein n=2 Tax=Chitinophaga niastensis TaxID=536980 RepID=A0A2P8HRT6_CHINA|nr:succinyltransferase-like protein [Chitinophaga niastensis]
MRYWNKFTRIIYYLLNARNYKYLDFKSAVLFSVRVTGKKYITVKRNSMVQRQGWLLAVKIDEHEPEIIIEENCAIGDFSHIVAVRSVHIEKSVLMANKVYISDNLHSYEDISRPVIDQPVVFKAKVRIGSGAWIGENVCIIGASIGKNSVIGANSVVTADIPDYCIAVGCPARVIKKFDQELNKWVSVK